MPDTFDPSDGATPAVATARRGLTADLDSDLAFLTSSPVCQQPEWAGHPRLAPVRRQLAAAPGLVRAADVAALRQLLARAAAGEFLVIQAGDCAEDFAECTVGHITRKAGLLQVLAGIVTANTGKPVVRVGRIAGQFGKPRSRPTERIGDLELPVYRGSMVNGPQPDPLIRRPDPARLAEGYRAASSAMEYLGWTGQDPPPHLGPRQPGDLPVWTSHEALLLDYEVPMLRRADDGEVFLASTHWPWIGDRTRQLDGAHVALLAGVANPVACKVGPGLTPAALVALCERLDPLREPGRLTLIARLGAAAVAARLPPLVAAVREAGHQVIWLTDPMHGNTVGGPDGLKTRFLETVLREVAEFRAAVAAAGGVAGGMHLESTPDPVTECVAHPGELGRVGEKYTSLCDPRLNPQQAFTVAAAWGAWTTTANDRSRG
ncbi:phospho-2-dehydro-3-deoxyheptonate aldolase [Streptomyces violarus]|uniref:Phospho-2-dehydro-3-deoxyheptonate aldolase n=1 Tax=Streptomyces violarus TaxID=67380 RepID=A0A7W4ZTB4_9ACTN|nr:MULTISPECIES: 3-deoxy-7-phosphoheptulonate synthase [Streptomyces]MBB3078096.1 3-deoxy-7-phosphoheptulonate synthase [Streptomyces violarus]WRT99749.1 3-deoxy-7-phosphoheptulonate synthase [Streptomyces sp. CGMCC 4.1772]GHD19668.1 phospho-2-dehydro-3-deoxyheptonate aldolase [Streptomyces violarus]